MAAEANKPGRRRVFGLLDPRDDAQTEPARQVDDLDEFLREAIERARDAFAKERDNIGEAYEDLEFRAGDHWPLEARQRREKQRRPILTINDVPQFVRRITGDIRLMRPSIKVVPIDAQADADVARVLSGMIRYIEGRSNARAAYALAADSQVACGVGHWRITTEYAQETTFNQEIRIVHVEDGVSVLWDPDSILPTREDATWCIVPVDLSRAKFRRKYPDIPVEDFSGYDQRYTQFWCGADTVRVAEYWEKRPATRRLAIHPNGAIHDLTNAPVGAEKKCAAEGAEIREREGFRVFRSLITLGHVLEPPEEWPGRHIPIVRVAGEEVRIGRRKVQHGVVRFIKDPARLYNYARSQQAELYGLAPKSPWLGTAKNFEEYRDAWETANEENWPYLEYTPDPANGNVMPQRIGPPSTSPGLSEAVAMSARDKQSVTGIYNSALGSRSNETSGVAIRVRESQSDVGNVVYVENFALAVAHTGAVILGLIPHVYDTERMVQIQDEKGDVATVTINRALVSGGLAPEPDEPEDIGVIFDADRARMPPADGGGEEPGAPDDGPRGEGASIDLDPQGTKQDHVSPDLDTGDACENDVTIGSYQIAFDTGPSYSTRREEARDGMTQLIRAVPGIAPVILDLYAKAQDWPMASEIAERLQAVLPPPVRAMIETERAGAERRPSPAPPPARPPVPPGGWPGPPVPPITPVQVAAVEAELAEAQAAVQTARLEDETKAIERDIRALELRIAAARSGEDGRLPDVVTQQFARSIAQLQATVAEIVAVLAQPHRESGA